MPTVRPLTSDSIRRKVLESMVLRKSQGRPRLPRRGRQGADDRSPVMRGEALRMDSELPDADEPEKRRTRREANR